MTDCITCWSTGPELKQHQYKDKSPLPWTIQRTLLPGTCCLRSLLNNSRYWVIVSTPSDGAKSPSGLAANTEGSSGTLGPRKDCMNSFVRFQQSPGTTQGQYSTWGKTRRVSADTVGKCHVSTLPVMHLTYLYRYPSGTGAHCHSADLNQEVTVTVSRTTALHFVPLGILKVTF